MRLDKYIFELLYRYECVVLPGFGAWLTQRVAAKYHKETHTFYPPKRAIQFNPALTHNDGLLAAHIARSESTTAEAAAAKIKSYVRYIEHQLDHSGYYSIEKLGRITKSEDGKLRFAPFYMQNHLLDAFGLNSFNLHPADAPMDLPIKKQEVIQEKAEDAPVETVDASAESFPSKQRVPYWRYAAVGLLALGVAGMIGSNRYAEHIAEYNQKAEQQAERMLLQKIQQAQFILPSSTEAHIEIHKKSKGNYHLIAGAFRDPENATKKIHQLKALGYGAEKIDVNRFGLHQVSFDSYETRAEALIALRNLKNSGYPEAWLYVKALE
ncbi:MAG: SPOR domain-containing protein [Flavobacteriaceae bacterium]|nr:SPOR domain-containing protein [Flavobacteriaceae bacterium]